MPFRPLDRVESIKTKIGIVIVLTVTVSAVTSTLARSVGLPPRVSIPVAIVVGLGVTRLLARGLTSPLREMTAAARRMAQGRYDVRVTATSADEVGELARAFNTMAADLAAVDRHRRELVANVSHELRTPIAALQAVLENLVDGVATADPATLRAALAQTERLGHLVTDLLDLSRVDAGVVPLVREPVAMAPFLESVVGGARLTGRPVEYVVTCPPGLTLHADPGRLHQLVANLVDNAAKHSPPGGVVAVCADRHGSSVTVEVADRGPGIAADQRSSVFEWFARGEGLAGDDTGGTGLGLAVARWVTSLHGGVIEVVDSDSGCRIRAVIPDQPDGPSEPVERAGPASLDDPPAAADAVVDAVAVAPRSSSAAPHG